MTKFQIIRLTKKAMRYPQQLTDDEVLQLNSLMNLSKDMVITDEQKAYADKILGINDSTK